MAGLSIDYLLAFALFVLPGAISMYIFGLLVAQGDRLLKDRVLEAICFSLLNFALCFWPIQLLFRDGFLHAYPLEAWLIALATLVVAPVIWPFVAHRLLRLAERRHWIAPQAKTAWDDYFLSRNEGIWIQVTLRDGNTVGGIFGQESFASSFPNQGHMFIQELWEIEDGKFKEPVAGKPGILLRPEDYLHLRVFEGVKQHDY